MAEAPIETIHLDGRDFFGVSQQVTAAQDDYILSWLGKAGATDILFRLAAGGEDSEQSAKNLLATILGSGYASKVLAGVLTEQGKKWRREDAERNAEIFADITANDEKVAMRTMLVRFVLGFFLLGEASSTTSPKSSSPNKKEPATVSEAPST
jgi:hypothetical protein